MGWVDAAMLVRRTLIVGSLAVPLLSGCGDPLRAHEERARFAWAATRLADRQQAETLPAVLAAVRAHAPQEREVLDEAAAALAEAEAVRVDESTPRNPVRWQEYLNARVRLSNAVQALLGAVERYLDLKRSAGFLAVRSPLIGAQDRAAVARDDYNEAARAYNAGLGGLSGWLARRQNPDARPLQLFTGLPTRPQ